MNDFLDLIRFDLDELRVTMDASGCPHVEHLVNILRMLDLCFLIEDAHMRECALWEVVQTITTFAILMQGTPIGILSMYPARLRRISMAIEFVLSINA